MDNVMLHDAEIERLTGTFNDFITNKTCGALSALLEEPVKHDMMHLRDGDALTPPVDSIKMCSVRLNAKGDLHIELLFITEVNHALKIASKLLGSELNKIDEMGTSALQEVANILTGSFFNALSENTGFRVDLSTPSFGEGDLQNLILEPKTDVVEHAKDAIVTDALLYGKQTGIQIHMLIIQHPEQARKVIAPEAIETRKNEYESDSNSNLLGGKNDAIDDLLAGFDVEVNTQSNSEIDALLGNTDNSNSDIDALINDNTEPNCEIDTLVKRSGE